MYSCLNLNFVTKLRRVLSNTTLQFQQSGNPAASTKDNQVMASSGAPELCDAGGFFITLMKHMLSLSCNERTCTMHLISLLHSLYIEFLLQSRQPPPLRDGRKRQFYHSRKSRSSSCFFQLTSLVRQGIEKKKLVAKGSSSRSQSFHHSGAAQSALFSAAAATGGDFNGLRRRLKCEQY